MNNEDAMAWAQATDTDVLAPVYESVLACVSTRKAFDDANAAYMQADRDYDDLFLRSLLHRLRGEPTPDTVALGVLRYRHLSIQRRSVMHRCNAEHGAACDTLIAAVLVARGVTL
jgi:hypothetical protein